MLDLLKKNKIIIGILIVIIAAFAWFGLSDQQPTTSLLSNESRSSNSAADQEILRVLLDMRSIRLDSSIFENPAFASLRDFGRDIVPEPVGRTNPFAPVGSTQTSSVNEAAGAAASQ